MVRHVELSKRARKEISQLPRHVVVKLLAWVSWVENRGLEEVRKVPGFHDEPLRGKRAGQRSIRLNRAYRAIYVLVAKNTVEFVCIEEVHKHDY